MQILITGGAGFIGSHTVEAALDAGHAVRVLDDLSSGDRAYLPAGVAFIEGDVTDAATVRDAVAGCDAVIHLAALVSVPQSLREPVRTHHVNTTGTVTLLDAAQHAGVARFVLASTCAVYGDLPGHKEESSRVQPLVPYAASKLMAEQWVQLYGRAYGMETIVLRYFNVYGPRQRADSPYSGVLARWCAAASQGQPCTIFGDGRQTRDFVSVHDVAQANLLAATHRELGTVLTQRRREAEARREDADTLLAATHRELGAVLTQRRGEAEVRREEREKAGALLVVPEPDRKSGRIDGGLYQVATGASVSLNDVLDALDAVAPQPVQRCYADARPGDILHSAGSSDRLQGLGWRAQVSLREGLAELVAG